MEGDAEVEAAKVCCSRRCSGFPPLLINVLFLSGCRTLQTKGYAEGAGDSLAGGLKKNAAKVVGNDSKEAEGRHRPAHPQLCACS